jgi:hypothetical protein
MSDNLIRFADWAAGPDPINQPIDVDPLPEGSIWADFSASVILVCEADGVDKASCAQTLRTIAAYIERPDGTREALEPAD